MKNAELSWQQGQPSSTQFDDVYFSAEDGLAETEHVFLAANQLPDLWQGKPQFVIAETGFGSGLNFFVTLQAWLDTAEADQHLFYYSVELFPFSADDLKKALSLWPQFEALLNELLAQYPPAVEGFHLLKLCNGRVTLCLMLGDVQDCLRQCRAQVDVWFLDGFAPAKNEAMWSPDVFKQIARLSKKGTRLSTFTAAGFVRRGLAAVGFEVKKVPAFGRKRDMLSAQMLQSVTFQQHKPWFQIAPYHAAKTAVIVGAGIAGLTTAYALLQRGWQVSLIEQYDKVAQQASGNPQALVMPKISLQSSADSQFYTAAFLYAVARLNYLTSQGFDGWKQTGVLQLACTARTIKQVKMLSPIKHFMDGLNAEQASDLAGIPLTHSALWFEQAGYCEPARLCEYLFEYLSQKIHLQFNTNINRIEQKGSRWQLFKQNTCIASADAVVLCNAYQSRQFSQTAYLPIAPARGQVSLLPVSSSSQNLTCPIVYDGYVMPAQQKRHLIGASFEQGDNSHHLRAEDDADNFHRLQQTVAHIFASRTDAEQSRASVRAVSHDRMPLVGAVADKEKIVDQYADLYKGRSHDAYQAAAYYPGLYINTAHGARGFVSSFLSAEIIAAQLNNEPLPVSSGVVDALHPSRLMIKQLYKRQYKGLNE